MLGPNSSVGAVFASDGEFDRDRIQHSVPKAMTLQEEMRRRLVDDLGYDKRIERDFSGTACHR